MAAKNEQQSKNEPRKGAAISDERITAALIASPTVRAAAAANVSEGTIYARLRDPLFRARYDAARRELLDVAILATQSRISNALAIIDEIATDETNAAAVRLQAAQTLLKTAAQFAPLTGAPNIDALTVQQAKQLQERANSDNATVGEIRLAIEAEKVLTEFHTTRAARKSAKFDEVLNLI